ncbi:MAG: capsular polysaccharide synthesis protein, partial [Acutalibacteraceae bacterium]|nr:capsular polysaccharide synthesis protein [Acutalibacteraceae bacterium]
MNKQQKIPKIIHYCWFGRGAIPEVVDKCIATWREKCPDYEIKLWNEDNFNVDLLKFTSDAYKQKKFAFVSDVARLWAVYNYGGIYLDVDVLLRAPLDEWLNYDTVFIGEDTQCINTGLGFAAVKNNKIVKAMLDDYNDREFVMKPCTILNTKIFINLYHEIE